MHLRSLTMKGFKSFADSTTVELEPGVTVVVGPNGSGKSNVVDAVAWVLGAQGPRVVRSQKMDDVIFAGTSKRAPLGRAEVSLVIDNADRRLPIEFTEVTITRTLFRSGDSEYQLNGVPCRLLDIQELLSDSGVGRTQHVIISQGQLDSILAAHPEDRRAVIEEAAGVLKFRRRRERAVRRLESSEQNLVRIQDLLREVRRQLRPLERQAEQAHAYSALTAELEQLRRFLAARELRALDQRLAADEATRRTLHTESAALSEQLVVTDGQLEVAEVALGDEPPDELAVPLGELGRLEEHARGLAALIEERTRSARALLAVLEDQSGHATLDHDAAAVRAELEELAREAGALSVESAELRSDEQRIAAAELAGVHEVTEATPGTAAENLAVARARLEELRAALESAAAGLERSSGRIASLSARLADHETARAAAEVAAERLRADLALREDVLVGKRELEDQADAAHRAAERELVAASEERHAAAARVEAFLDALEGVRARAGVDRLFGLPGVLGTLLELVEVDDGIALAFEAAVEHAISAIVVGGIEDARAALAHLLAIGEQAALLVAPAGSSRPGVSGERTMRERVRGATPEVDRLLDELVGSVVLAESLEQALDTVAADPSRTVVTVDGDRFAPDGWRIGAARTGATTAALDAARVRLSAADERHEEAVLRASDAARTAERARTVREQVEAELAPVPVELEALQRQVREHAVAAEAIAPELDAARAEHEAATRAAEQHGIQITGLEATLAELVALAAREHDTQLEREQARLAREQQRAAFEQRARELARREAALAERRAMLERRAVELESELISRQDLIAGAARERDATSAQREVLGLLAQVITPLLGELSAMASRVQDEQRARGARLAVRLDGLTRLRAARDRLQADLARLNERAQRLELEATEARVRREAAVESLRHELDLSAEELLASPQVEPGAGVDPAARRRQVERELREIGPVNLLAEEELTALVERNNFLEGQLEDVRNARRELNQVIQAVDQEIVTVFSEAFADVAHHFERLIETLFPGGSGSLSLTAPDDLLNTGVEIEARPAGRNVRRLSLLSGGERSLVALAFLFAVFRSRPSPFYLMDEVEAALDDANLQRFLALLEDFRDEAQLVVVSHQKRTMEIADSLYGVSMQPGGASKVVSERLRDREPNQRRTQVHEASSSPAP